MTGWKVAAVVVGSMAIGWMGMAERAIAADTIILTYGILEMEIPVEDIEALAETGETSDKLGRLLDSADQDPDTLRATLNQSIEVSPVVLDNALNSFPGEWLLDEISETVRPASGEAGRKALRGALIGAAADDNQITLLEVMQGYPSPEIRVDGRGLIEFYGQVVTVVEPLMDLARVLERIID